VDGSRAARHALLWAARQARIRQSLLVVTHVDPLSPDAVGLSGDPVGSEAILESSAAAASQREPSVTVATLLLRGSVTDELIKLSATASMLVVGVDPTTSRANHGLLGPVEDRVVVNASCPVVTVHDSRPTIPHSVPDVTVRWTDDSGSGVIGRAAEEAAVRDASLTIVSVSPAQQGLDGDSRTDRAGAAADGMSEALSVVSRHYPDLMIRAVQERGDILSALLRQSQYSELLVVSCPGRQDRRGIRLAPIVAALTHEAPCPVMLVGPVFTHTP